MRRAVLGLLGAAMAAGCGDSQAPAPTASLRQPAAIAAFMGKTISAPGTLAPYFAVANASRNDLALVDAVNDLPVLAPVRLEALRIHLDRPALLASASLGDGLADLLVAVSGGDSVLQLVRTWSTENAVVGLVDLGADIVAIAPLPPTPGVQGRARLAVALSDRRFAVVEYERAPIGSPTPDAIVLRGLTVGALPFQPEALAAISPEAAVPGDENVVYAASLEPVADAVFGVGAIDLGTPPAAGGLWPTRGLDARAPTRLVAATRLRERAATYPPPADPATDIAPFVGQPEVERVYAVLDESACGIAHRIDCGVAILDPASGLLPDPAGRMPYLAPIQLAGRPAALAVAAPPFRGPPDAPVGAPYAGGPPDLPSPEYMRLAPASGAVATTAVGAVALDTGAVVFLDLGRWKVANDAAILTAGTSVTPSSRFRDVPVDAGTPTVQQRLWLKSQAAGPGDPFLGAEQGADGVTVTPGYTRNDTFSVTYQGILPELSQRSAEAGRDDATGQVWLALQTGDAADGRILERVEIAHPRLGVAVGAGDAGDIVQIDATLLPACLARLEAPGRAGGSNDRRFEARAAAFLPPTVDHPGGALLLEKEADPDFAACYDDLAATIPAGGRRVATRLLATLRAHGLVMTSAALGYAGRPTLGETFALAYPAPPGDEDALTGEEQVLARKARPHYHVSEQCPAPVEGTEDTCRARWPDLTFPLPIGPVIRFHVDLERVPPPPAGETPAPLRDSVLQLTTASGVAPFSARPGSGVSSHPTGAIAFDRSPFTDGAPGYRFLVPYASDVVLDAAPANALAAPVIIR